MPYWVYIDTNILGLVFDSDVSQGVAEAIGELCDFGDLEFVTSRKALQEVLKHEDLVKRSLLKLIHRFMSKLPEANLVDFVPALYGTMMFGEGTYAGGAHGPDALLSSLTKLFGKDDAEHIFQAARGNCDFFLTLDSKIILTGSSSHRDECRNICPGLQFVDPQELLAILRNWKQKRPDRE